VGYYAHQHHIQEVVEMDPNPAIDRALKDVEAGMSVYRAARVHGISASSIYSRLAREKAKVALSIARCPCCGRESDSTTWDADALSAKAKKVIGGAK
jgi:hypothetical protein